ncbi:MAG: tRNA-dihydrouridine synthase [Actinomycetota bacterium]
MTATSGTVPEVVGTRPGRLPLRLGEREFPVPVVLAPMAGVTNAPFRTLCREEGPGLVYVSEMVMAAALVHGNDRTRRMVGFTPDEDFRSLQIYGSDPDFVGRAVRELCRGGLVDHIDMNFGCPATKVTRKGGGAAVPVKRNLLRAIIRAAVTEAAPHGIPVTAKFRIGLDDDIVTFLDTGTIAEEEGVAAVALHARTARQHYAGEARWEAIAELKNRVRTIPVLGNGDVWEAADAVRMMEETGCDGVVVGRGCLGKPWLFRDLVAAFTGAPVPGPPALGEVAAMMTRHAELLCRHMGDEAGIRNFRKHAGWYLTGYPVGTEARRRFSLVASLGELASLCDALDPGVRLPDSARRLPRGHTNGPITVVLPENYLENRDDMTVPEDGAIRIPSGG